MEKIIIISDTHGNQLLLRKALMNEKYDYIFHLGDNYNDLDSNNDLTEGKHIFRVPGIYHPGFTNRTIPAVVQCDILDWNFLLTHDIASLKKKPNSNVILLHGHTHRSEFLKFSNNVFRINPGHLKRNSDRGREASYILANATRNQIRFDFKKVNGELLNQNI